MNECVSAGPIGVTWVGGKVSHPGRLRMIASKRTKGVSKKTSEVVPEELLGEPRRSEGVTIDVVEKRSPWNSREVLAVDVYCESLRKEAKF